MVMKSDAISTLYPEAVIGPVAPDVVLDANGISYWPPSLGPQPSQATLDAVTQEQVDAARLAKLRALAKQFQDDQQAQNVALRVTVKLLVDELNVLSQWLTSFKSETAAATSLADLKTRVATLPNTPDRTYAQAKTAINNLIDGE